jgi:ABC-2 type transport system ATP-binding protein
MYKKERNYEVKTNSIEVRNFSKKFGDFTAVDNISFDVEQGTIFAFLGPNGAGKSTTINTLCTIQEKTEGMLKINGNDVSKQKDLVRNDIGIVFQDSTMDGKLTVEENLKLHCDFYKVPKSEMKERIDFVLDLVDIKSRKKSPVDSLSGGMKRRAEIARGLVHFPKVLFLDEPTTGLDPQTRASVWDYIHKLQKQKNITIFLTTHYMDEAEICNQVAIIDGGKIVAHDTPANLKKKYTSTTMKLKTNDPDSLKTYLTERSIKHSVDKDLVTIYATSTADVLDISNTFRESIEDIEINKGTLNDVFIAITGKEIRE